MRKAVLFSICAWFFYSASASVAASLTVRIPATDAVVGTEIKVPIMIEHAADLGAVEIDLAYDSRLLEFVKLEAGRINSGMVDFKLVRPGLVRIGSIAEPSLSGDGELFVIALKVLGLGKSSLDFQRVKANAGTSGAEIPITPQSGTLTAQAAAPPTATPTPSRTPASAATGPSAAGGYVTPRGGGANWIWMVGAGLGVGILILLVAIAFLLGRRHSSR